MYFGNSSFEGEVREQLIALHAVKLRTFCNFLLLNRSVLSDLEKMGDEYGGESCCEEGKK